MNEATPTVAPLPATLPMVTRRQFRIPCEEGVIVVAKHRRFGLYVQNIQFWFCVHYLTPEPEVTDTLVIAEWFTGRRITTVQPSSCHGAFTSKERAVFSLGLKIREAGEARVRSVLSAAPGQYPIINPTLY